MSVTPIRHRTAAAMAVAVMSVFVLGACTTGQQDAGNYADTEDEFIAGCIATATSDSEAGAPNAIASPESYCQCVFDTLSDEQDGVEFERFKEINSELRDEGGPLPDDFQEAYASCSPGEA